MRAQKRSPVSASLTVRARSQAGRVGQLLQDPSFRISEQLGETVALLPCGEALVLVRKPMQKKRKIAKKAYVVTKQLKQGEGTKKEDWELAGQEDGNMLLI